MYFVRIGVTFGVLFEVIDIENLVREVWRHQHVDVQINVTQNASVKTRRLIDVAVKVLQRLI